MPGFYLTAGPANYTNFLVHDTTLAVARRELNAASENPGRFTLSQDRFWVAGTIAVHPPEAPPSLVTITLPAVPDYENDAAETAAATPGTGRSSLLWAVIVSPRTPSYAPASISYAERQVSGAAVERSGTAVACKPWLCDE